VLGEDMKDFKFVYKGNNHWDVFMEKKRVCMIRGIKGNFYILSIVNYIHEKPFKTVLDAMTYICDSLIYEE